MKTLSRNPKRNAVVLDTWEYLDDLGINEVRHYIREFPREPNHNIAAYGSARVCYADVRELLHRAGYVFAYRERKRTTESGERGDYLYSDDRIWSIYRQIVGQTADEYVKRNGVLR